MRVKASGDKINNSVMLFLSPVEARYVANAMIDAMSNDSTTNGYRNAQDVLTAIEGVIGRTGIDFVDA